MTLGIRSAQNVFLYSCAHHPDVSSDHVDYKVPEYNRVCAWLLRVPVSPPPFWAGLIIEWRNKCICCPSILHSRCLCCKLLLLVCMFVCCWLHASVCLLLFACLHGLLLLIMLCCAVLCCAVLCCAVLCCAVLCCAVLCCAVLCCADLH